nr:serine carboxypeptidase [Arabidopsis thaliana]
MGKECYYLSWILKFHLLLVLIQLVDSGSTIRFLPGFQGPLPFELETGISDLFELQTTTKNKNAGPIAFKAEEYNGSIPSLVSTTYAWTKVASILYLDQPVGTGFSYSRNPLADIPSDTGVAKPVNEFLHKWLDKHPEFLSNPLYVAGNSYSGIVIPTIVQEISNGNHLDSKPQINLQGFVLGNPATDTDIDLNSRIPFAHGKALISDEHYESLKRSCQGNYISVNPRNTKCLKLLEDFKKCVSGISEEYILKPDCMWLYSCMANLHSLSEYWANEKSVRKALLVNEGTVRKWIRCNTEIAYNKDIRSSVPYHKYISIEGYRSLVFSGDHDMLVPFLGTQAWIRSLNYSIVDDWRPWMVQNQVAGYTRTYANKMTFATVKGGGHTSEYKPVETYIMIKRWLSGQPL